MVTKSVIFNALESKYIVRVQGFKFVIFCLKTVRYINNKEMTLTQKQFQLMFVSITILIVGIMFWICIIHSLVFFECEFPDDYWLSASIWKISLFNSFALITLIVFIWNVCIYFFIHEKSERNVSSIFFVANLIVLIVASVILYHHYNFLNEHRITHYQKVEGTYVVAEDDWFDDGITICSQREKYVGQWRIVEKSIDFSTDEIFIFERNGKIKSENNQWNGHWRGTFGGTNFRYKTPEDRDLVEYRLDASELKFGSIRFDVLQCESGFCQTKYNKWLLELSDKKILMMKFDYYLNSLSGEYVVLEREKPYKQLEFVP